MPSYEKTSSWGRTLAEQGGDDSRADERELLRAAYRRVRSRAQAMGESIGATLPAFTVHDLSHSDALWEYADLIAGTEYGLTPSESFVLGCAFLIHDLGMGLAAYPGGIEEIESTVLWNDVYSTKLAQIAREDASDGVAERDPLRAAVLPEVLRRRHAEIAYHLPLRSWTASSGEQYYLIEDADLRTAFGPIIGRIASSHWSPAEELPSLFPAIMGAQVGLPSAWTVDALKVACILRCADYCHIDERRAPGFLWALRRPFGESEQHWSFQEKLNRPRLEHDRLIFTSKGDFRVDDADAWWLCFDTLSAIDEELRSVDALLADSGRDRFAARGVAQAGSPRRLAQLIRVDGWDPVEARVKVSAVAKLVKMLGGKELYADELNPPLRELIQNGADAVRARRQLEDRPIDWGEIRVSRGTDESGQWLQVEDSGVGMSEAVLTGPLLDFGSSFWRTPQMWEELPGLAGSGFTPTGRYGIGFFSVFMWGDRVKVTSRRFDKAKADTFVLEFTNALNSRPMFRRGEGREQMLEGGTQVTVWFSSERLRKLHKSAGSLGEWCTRLAPCLDVTVVATEPGEASQRVVVANDWLTIDAEALVDRIEPRDRWDRPRPLPALQILRSPEGSAIGRAALWYSTGAVTVDGLRAGSAGGIVGVVTGKAARAARDKATTDLNLEQLQAWVEDQCEARLQENLAESLLMEIAETAIGFGIKPGRLPVAWSQVGWLNLAQIAALAGEFDEVYILDQRDLGLRCPLGEDLELGPAVLVSYTDDSWILRESPWPSMETPGAWRELHNRTFSLVRAITEALAEGWGVQVEAVLEDGFFAEPRVIGQLRGKPYEEHVHIIRRSSAARHD